MGSNTMQVNFSLNGIPGTLWEIRKQENIHPYLGLRQAILIINAKEKALLDGKLAQKKALLSIKKQKESLTSLQGDESEIRAAEIEIAEHDARMFEQLILDAEMELKTATQEKTRIETANPDMASESYEYLQIKYANEAFRSKLTRSLVISIYGSYKMLSEGAAELVYDAACFTPAERQQFDTDTFQQLSQLLVVAPNPQLSTSIEGDSDGFITN